MSLGKLNPQFQLEDKCIAVINGMPRRFLGRTRDKHRRLLFDADDGTRLDLSDVEMLEMQQRGDLRLLTAIEALAYSNENKRIRVTLDVFNQQDEVERAKYEAYCAETMRKSAYCQGWEDAGRPSRTPPKVAPVLARVAEAIGDKHPPSPRHALRWVSEWIEGGCVPDAVVPQILNRGNRTDRLELQRELLTKIVEEEYLVDTRPSGVAVHRAVKAAFAEHNKPLPEGQKLRCPSLNAVYAEIRRIDAYTLDYCREGPREANRRHRPVASGPVADRHNDVWEIDHTKVNAIAVDEVSRKPIGRPWVTVILDRATRMCVGFFVTFAPPGTWSVMECLAMALLPKEDALARVKGLSAPWPCFGGPKVIVPDRGKEFRSLTFVEAVARLGARVEYAPALKAWYKGRIERFIQTLSRHVFERVEGTTFANWFLRNKESIPEKVARTTLTELNEHVTRYIVNVYHRRSHRSLGSSPLRAYEESVARHGMRPPLGPDQVAVLTSPPSWRKVQRTGIRYELVDYADQDGILADLSVQPLLRFVQFRPDRRDVSIGHFLDPRDGIWKVARAQGRWRERLRGMALEMHLRLRAIQRENPEAFGEDEEGYEAAAAEFDARIKKGMTQKGLKNRERAKSAWEKARRRLESEEPSFDEAASGQDIAEGIFGAPEGETLPKGGHVNAPAPLPDAGARPAPKRKRKSKPAPEPVAKAPATGGNDADSSDEDGIDFDAVVRGKIHRNE